MEWEISQSLLQNSKTLVLKLGNYKHILIKVIHKVRHCSLFSLPLKRITFEKFLKKTDDIPCQHTQQEPKDATHHVPPTRRGPRYLETRPLSLQTQSEGPTSLPTSELGPGRSLAAALAQAPSSSSLTPSAHRDRKDLRSHPLTLSRCSRTCHLLVSA